LEAINQKEKASFRGTLRQENSEPNAGHEEREESQNHLTPDGYCGSHYLQTTAWSILFCLRIIVFG
jgi:hypothetical protein